MIDIEKTAHILGKLAKDYEEVMVSRGRSHWKKVTNEKRYSDLVTLQERQIKELQEGTPQCQS